MDMQISHSICPKVQKKGYIQANKSRYRSHIE